MTDVSAADTTMLKDSTTAPLKYQHRIEKKIHHSRVSIESLKDGILSRTYYILLAPTGALVVMMVYYI